MEDKELDTLIKEHLYNNLKYNYNYTIQDLRKKVGMRHMGEKQRDFFALVYFLVCFNYFGDFFISKTEFSHCLYLCIHGITFPFCDTIIPYFREFVNR